MGYRIEASSPLASTPEQRRSRWRLAVVVLGIALLLAVSAGLGAAGGYWLARRALATASLAAPIAQGVAVRVDSAVIDAVQKVKPAVVTVVSVLPAQSYVPPGYAPFGFGPSLKQQELRASGSGVIIDDQGHIVTNFHVVDKATRLEVIFADGTKAANPATLVGADPYSDLAVLRIDDPPPAFAALGDSSALQPGETVVAIGSPLGEFRGSVTVGVISALNRKLDVSQDMALEGLIQTDAAINQGNSGGPLVNLAGQVVGINTAVLRSTGGTTRSASSVAEGLGFAIPSARARDVANQLITSGRVEYPYLGVRYQQITPALAAVYGLPVGNGLFIHDVERGSAAAQAGLQRGDIVTNIDGVPLDEEHSLVNVLMRHKVGDVVGVTIYRGSQRLELKVTLTGR